LALHALFAGRDGPGERALPAGEFLHPLPLCALAVLVVNDWYLKGAQVLPGIVTGKLSDFAGLLFFPLLCTALADVALWGAARAGAPVDFSLGRGRLAVACAGTAALFAATKLSDAWAGGVVAALGWIGVDARIVVDPTDLLALPSVAVAYWLGRREIARVPLGRLEVIERRWRRGRTDVAAQLRDVRRAGADAGAVAALADGLTLYHRSGERAAADAALAALRAR
jgi:hypothetical protein